MSRAQINHGAGSENSSVENYKRYYDQNDYDNNDQSFQDERQKNDKYFMEKSRQKYQEYLDSKKKKVEDTKVNNLLEP